MTITRLAIVIGILLAAGGAALAHGGYDWIRIKDFRNPRTGQTCCGPKDCHRVADRMIRRQGADYVVTVAEAKATMRFPAKDTFLSDDFDNWVCVNGYLRPPQIRCLFLKGTM